MFFVLFRLSPFNGRGYHLTTIFKLFAQFLEFNRFRVGSFVSDQNDQRERIYFLHTHVPQNFFLSNCQKREGWRICFIHRKTEKHMIVRDFSTLWKLVLRAEDWRCVGGVSGIA